MTTGTPTTGTPAAGAPRTGAPQIADATMTADVGGLKIRFDDRVLRPRPWTAAQGEWAADLARRLPPGPILELFCGAGHVGLVAASLSGRQLVQVDADPHACELARTNAAAAGLGDLVEVRTRDAADATDPGERFPILLADPPYLPTSALDAVPEDPGLAVDGGPDGLDLVRRTLGVLTRYLSPEGRALLQLRGPDQVRAVRQIVPASLHAGQARHYARDRSVLMLRPVGAPPSAP